MTPGSQRVRLDRGLVKQALASAPAQFTLHARNPAHDLPIGGRRIVFGTVGSAPNASDTDNGRRPGNYQDYLNFLRLGQSFNIVHYIGGYPVEPVDLHPATRHLDCVRDMLCLTDKVPYAYSLGRRRILDFQDRLNVGHALGRAQAIEAHHAFDAVGGLGFAEQRQGLAPRRVLVSRRDGVFQIDTDNIGTGPQRLGEHLGPVAGAEDEAAPRADRRSVAIGSAHP